VKKAAPTPPSDRTDLLQQLERYLRELLRPVGPPQWALDARRETPLEELARETRAMYHPDGSLVSTPRRKSPKPIGRVKR
jgi:hypothetical protein